MTGKWPFPLIETTVNIAQPSKRVKKKAKKWAHEIFVISSQDTQATIPETTHHSAAAKVPMGTLPDSLFPTVNQTTTVQLIEKLTVLVE